MTDDQQRDELGSQLRRVWWITGAVLLIALALRFPGVLSGPGSGDRDELNYVPKAVRFGGGDLNPHYFHNPPLASYLMFVAMMVRFLAGRITGEYAGAVDFKAQFLAGAPEAFVAARAVSVAAGVATVFVTMRLVSTLRGPDRRSWVPVIAGLAAATSPLLVERSLIATNESLCTLAFTYAVYRAVLLAQQGTLRCALIAGIAAGVAGGAKYTGALACASVGIAAIASAPAHASAPSRVRRAVVAGLAAIAAFIVVCPWVFLDSATFRLHLIDLGAVFDRYRDGRSVARYASALWTTGLGPVLTSACAVGLVVLTVGVLRGPRELRPQRLAVIAGPVALVTVLVMNTQMANGRYIMPAIPALIALAAAEVDGVAPRWAPWARRFLAIGGIAWVAIVVPESVGRFATRLAHDPHDDIRAWLRENVPDGAHIVTDWHAPRLPPIHVRVEHGSHVSDKTRALLTPAWRLTMAYDYFVLPVRTLEGTDIPVDDLDRLATAGPVWFVLSDNGERILASLPEPTPPAPLLFHRRVRETVPVMKEFPLNAPGQGAIRVHRLDRR